MNLLQSRGTKRNIGGAIVILPMLVKYALTLINRQTGTEFEVDDNLLNVLYAVGSFVWTTGSVHAYLPRVLKWTLWIERALERFNMWAIAKLKKGGK